MAGDEQGHLHTLGGEDPSVTISFNLCLGGGGEAFAIRQKPGFHRKAPEPQLSAHRLGSAAIASSVLRLRLRPFYAAQPVSNVVPCLGGGCERELRGRGRGPASLAKGSGVFCQGRAGQSRGSPCFGLPTLVDW